MLPPQAKAKGLTSWLGAGNNPSLSRPNPMRGGRPAQQNPYLKLAGANANRQRLGRGFTSPSRGFQQGLGQAYQNFLGGQATTGGPSPAMRKPRGKAFRGDIGLARARRMKMRNLQRQRVRRGGMPSPGFPSGPLRPDVMPTKDPIRTTQPYQQIPEYATRPAPQPTQDQLYKSDVMPAKQPTQNQLYASDVMPNQGFTR